MMKKNKFEKNEIYDLPVKEVRTENDRSYFIVEAEGREYAIRLFKFQKEEPVPPTLSCLVKDMDEEGPVFVQNYSSLVQRFYRKGETYTFWIRKELSDINEGYYELGDSNGLFFRLQVDKNTKLQIRQKVDCVVKSMKNGRLYLKLVKDENKNDNCEFLLLEEILGAVGVSEVLLRWLNRIFKRSPELSEAREALSCGDGSWVMMSVSLLNRQLDEWVKRAGRRREMLLDVYHRACLYLLEDSDGLKKFKEEERDSHIQLLTQAIGRAKEYLEAVRLIVKGEHGTYVAALFSKISKTGCLYEPEHKLRVTACLFRLEPELLERMIQELFGLIVDKALANSLSEPYKSAFVGWLELYIAKCHIRFDRISGIETAGDEQNIKNLIVALAIQLLLVGEEEGFGRQVKRSMLYRYLTYLKGSSSGILLEKAFCSVVNSLRQKLEFDWKDVRDMTLLTIRLSYPIAKDDCGEDDVVRNYEGEKARLSIQEDCIRLFPAGKTKKLYAGLPEWLLPWHRMQVLLPHTDVENIAKETKELVNYQTLWKEVEYELLNNTEVKAVKPGRRKLRPDIGDKVMIRVLHQDPQSSDCFYCRMEDDVYEGEGTIKVYNIVRYNLHTDVSAFYSNAGKPYLIQAEVIGVDKKGIFRFKMMNLLDSFLYQGVYVGDNVQCVVTDCQQGSYTCISNFGYSMQVLKVPGMPELSVADYIEVEVNEVCANGSIKADFLRQVVAAFSVEDAFANLIYNYADERVYEEAEEESEFVRQTGTLMDEASVFELMQLVDRQATLDEDYIKTYNYLGFARILALMLDKEEVAEYYSEQMKLLQLLQQFAINGQMDMKALKERDTACRRLLPHYPAIESGLLELLVLGSLSCPAQNAFLWKVVQQSGNERREKLSRLVLAYNLLGGFSMNKQKDAILSQMYAILHMDVGRYKLHSFGREDQHTEFKSSVVFPADNRMRADVQKQTLEIMIVICGFLNAEGGMLYLGVNNEGVACGLDADLKFFGGSLDKLDLHVRNNVVRYMGTEVNARISVSYPPAGGKLVYAMEIKPCPHPVKCNGIYYQRQGSSSWPLLGKALDAFLESRACESDWTEKQVPVDIPAEEDLLLLPETAEAEQVSDTVEKEEATELKPADEIIATSMVRPNVLHSWTEGYGVGTLRYLHMLAGNNYLMTEEECWRNDVVLSMAIHESEADGYLINVFESGRIVRVPINELLDKKLDKEYKRYGQEKLVFSCPAHKDDALLTIMRDAQQRSAYRLDDVKNLKGGNMLAKGDFLSVVEVMSVIQCEIIPAAKKSAFKRIHNLKSTHIGLNLNVYWGGDELQELENMGIKLKPES